MLQDKFEDLDEIDITGFLMGDEGVDDLAIGIAEVLNLIVERINILTAKVEVLGGLLPNN